MKNIRKNLLVLVLLCVALLPCFGTGSQEEDNILKIGLMPAVDTAPIFLALDSGYFEEEGINVEITLFTNAQDRQSALQSGAIDGAMTDLVALAVNRSGGFPVKATTLTDGMFPVLAGADKKEEKSITIGLMEISVSNFLVDEWLSDSYEVEKIYVNAIPARLEAVLSGQLDMGLFPEPIATVGALKGLEKLIFEPVDGYCPDVMIFTETALTRVEVLEAFHRAYDRAVKEIVADQRLARETLIRNIPNLKPELRDLFLLPRYSETRLPDEVFLQKIIDWTDGITSQKISVSPEDLVDRRFVSQ